MKMTNQKTRKRIAHTFFSAILCIVFSALSMIICFASTNVKGFSVYRQGNTGNVSGHAGLVYSTNIDTSNAIVHVISGDSNYLIRKTSLNTFIDGQDFYGYYVPKTLKNYSQTDQMNLRSKVISKAHALAAINRDSLGYNVLYQVWYSKDSNSNGIVDLNEITSMRCDGLIEYCYEFYGLTVYGDNISKFNTSIRNNHCAPNVTPKQQIKHHLQNCLGDVDANLTVSADDARSVLRFASRLDSMDTYQKFVADVDGDGNVSADDSRLILRYASKLESSFPGDPFP